MKTDKMIIAKIGRTIGLHGDLKLNLYTDFPEQFKPGTVFASDRGDLEIENYDSKKNLIRFVGYDTMESARPLTNTKIYSTLEKTKKQIELGEGEYFWFDIIGSSIIDDGETIGIVEGIDRMIDIDYLSISTDRKLVSSGLPKSFLLPYISRYIVDFDSVSRSIHTVDARSVLEAS